MLLYVRRKESREGRVAYTCTNTDTDTKTSTSTSPHIMLSPRTYLDVLHIHKIAQKYTLAWVQKGIGSVRSQGSGLVRVVP